MWFTVTFKTPGGSHVPVTVHAPNGHPRWARWIASIEMKSAGFSAQCHMWPSTVRAHA